MWNTAPCSLQILPMQGISLMVPSSLFAHMMDTKMVSSRRASLTIWAVMMPSDPGSKNVTSKPSRSKRRHGSITALCSWTAVMMCPRCSEPAGALAYIRAAPLMAMLFDSVAPEVKMISFGLSPQKIGDLRSCGVHSVFGFPAVRVVSAAGVAVNRGEVGEHGVHHPLVARGGRSMVKIDGGVLCSHGL